MEIKKNKHVFPNDFLWGASTSAIQVEGAIDVDGRGPSVIDDFRLSDKVCDFSVCCDHYHHLEEDLALMAELGLKSYRFSVSWSRIIPKGNGEINEKGLEFYHQLIDGLIEHGIEPVLTIYHFDYPKGLVEQYGGWSDRRSIEDFVNFCKILFEEYGSKVRYWLTINEQDHVIRIAPRMGLTGKEPNYHQRRYQANHHMCVATAKAIHLLHQMYPESKIGPALSYAPVYPITSKPEDVQAASDATSLMFTYLADLQCFGRYPIRLWKYLKDRNWLPIIEKGDMDLMKQNIPDFIAINYYTSFSAQYDPLIDKNAMGKDNGDIMALNEPGVYKLAKNPNLPLSSYGLAIDPIGLRLSLEELYERYHLPLMITENGLSFKDILEDETVNDDYRIEYYTKHIEAMEDAIETGVELLGYHIWSFMDVTSSHEGFRKRYGLIYVNRDNFDLKDMKRYKKKSFYWYKKLIESNGKNR